MSKRFIDTDIWTQNKWFRKLDPKYKIFWYYLISNCDAVGVWEEDIELASFIIKHEYTVEEILEIFGERVKVFSDNKKWWLKDFCTFQYGELKDDPHNKPHTVYIRKLKEHRLFIDYTKSIDRLKEKEKDKEKDKEYRGIRKEIIIYLNEKSKKNFSPNSAKAKTSINARLSDGYSLDDFKKVIDNKCADWNDDPQHNQYLRPETLFGAKFDGYLNQKKVSKKPGGPYLEGDKNYGF